MRSLGAEAREAGRVYLTGGASAVLRGWREGTVDVDIKIVPENDLDDVDSMIRDGLVEPRRLADLFAQIESSLYRYPAVDPASLRAAVSRIASR